jgi:glucokinase
LRQRFEHVSYERVCSGSGIPNLYDFLEQRGELRAENWLQAQLAAASNPTPIIVDAGVNGRGRSALCVATLELFARILGAEAGNSALRFLATGGVYLGGTLVQRIMPIIEQPPFLDAFLHKGRLSELLQRVPLHIITRPNAALFGTIHYALGEVGSLG